MRQLQQSRQGGKPAEQGQSGPIPGERAPRVGKSRSVAGKLPAEVSAFCRRLGHRFKNPDLLVEALTHPSVSSATRPTNQRLEFLGDRVLGLVIAEELLAADRHANEGELALRFNSLVRKETCADVARQLDLGKALRMGRPLVLSGGRRKDAALGDALEAVIAAVFVDSGFVAARSVVLAAWGDRIGEAERDSKDPKTALQEWAHSQGHAPPEYLLVTRAGPDHAPMFTIQVRLDSGETATADARSKKLAEQDAARTLLQRVGALRLA